jgi:glycosyltransferase involved in cell wall biosynthesis
MTKVTFYIPCYNAEKTIRECLESIIGQTYPIDEIIVIDDGCLDKTVDIVLKYPVRVIRHSGNKGLAASRNTAFREAKNEFVASLDADCTAHPEWLERLMLSFSNDNIAGAGGMLIEKYSQTPADKWRSAHMAQMWGEEFIQDPPFLYGSNAVFRKKAVLSVGMYNEIFRNNHEDVNLAMLIYDKGYSLIYDPKAIVEHLRRDSVLSVLNNYWNWRCFSNIRVAGLSSFYREIAARLGCAFGLSDGIWELFMQDCRSRDRRLILTSLAALFYYPCLNIKYLTNMFIPWIKKT